MATLTAIISGVKTALTASLFASNNCFLSVIDEKDHLAYPPTDRFCIVRPVRFGVKDRAFATGTPGRNNLLVSQTVEVWLYVRLALDPYPRSDYYLTDVSLGSLTLTDSVIDTLQSYTATDGTNKWGYQLGDITWKYRQDGEGVGWGVTKLSYSTDLTGRG